MASDGDVFGRAVADYYSGKRYRFELERDDGFIDDQNMGVYFEGYRRFPEAEKTALSHVMGTVLDIGAGAGRIALHLQEKGLEVVGIDVSDQALQVCRLRGVRELVKMSACNLGFRRNSFDAAIAFCNNFGLCGNMQAVEKMLTELHSIIRDGGVFLASSIQPKRTRNPAHLRYHEMNLLRGRPPGQVTLRARYRGETGPWWDLLMVTPSELKELCNGTGWRVERTYRSAMDVHVLRKA